MELMRTHIGQSLRAARIQQRRTLREVASDARVSLGYLSEVERGQKEASSELLNAICRALNLSLATVLTDVIELVKRHETPVLTVVPTSEFDSDVNAA
ncbi:MAG: helix-turn-helix domain-containing protein [Acidobacteria bacterium]|nr:helix-turn-helix domain-containing protein [Acidobacteriota bacterium]